MEHVFEPFFTTKPVGEGSGLGLSSVFGFVNQSGGHIRLTSELGTGTEARIYFPRHVERVMEQDTESDGAPVEHWQRGCGETILLVDDDDAVRDSTTAMLEGLGYRVVDGSDGRKLSNEPAVFRNADLLLTDVILGGGRNGPMIACWAEEFCPGIKVLMMTGYGDPGIADTEQTKRDYPILKKPFGIADLGLAVSGVLRRAGGNEMPRQIDGRSDGQGSENAPTTGA